MIRVTGDQRAATLLPSVQALNTRSTCVVTLVRRSFRSCRHAAAASLPALSLVQRLEQALQTRG